MPWVHKTDIQRANTLAEVDVNNDVSRLRRLTPGDAAIYREVRLQGLKDHPEAFGADFEAEAAMPLEAFAERLTANATWGVFVGEELAGIATLLIPGGVKTRHKGMIVGVYVRPDARGCGAAQLLMQAALEFAHGRVELVQLGVGSENMAARRLYEGFGFKVFGLEPMAYKLQGRYVDDLLMWRRA